MMKKNDNIEKDAAFLRANIETNEKRFPFPENLSGDSIAELVSGKKQKKNKKAVIRAFAGAAAAACVALGIFFWADYGIYAPKEIASTNGAGIPFAESYDDIVSVVKDYSKYTKAKNAVRGFDLAGAKSADAAEAADMVSAAAEGSANYGAYNSAVTAASGSMVESKASAGPDFAETNTRAEGVGEADSVQTDGSYIYVSTYNNMIGIFKAESDGTLTVAGIIDCNYDIAGTEDGHSNTSAREFYVSGDRLIVLADYWHYGEDWYSDRVSCGVMIYDIADRTAPKLIRSMFQDGSYVSSRVVGSDLIMISNYYIDPYKGDYTVENVIPGVYNGAREEKTCIAAGDIALMNTAEPDSYVVVSKADLGDLERSPETLAVFGGGCEVYCTSETLYVYNTEYRVSSGFAVDLLFRDTASTAASGTEDETTTTVVSFDITGEKPVLKAQGKIQGYLLNTYSLDEYNGYLRMAATGNSENTVYVLDGDLKEAGRLDGIAPGEVIKSVRFSGDTAYVVTFIQTDPLFVIDLSDPAAPKVTGEVKLPGFSSYLHPVGDGLMLGIGSGGTEDGVDGSAKISLFDVSDPAAPKEADSIVVKDAYFNSYYKAFVTVKADGSFIIPANRYGMYGTDDGTTAYYGFSGATGALHFAVEDGKLVQLCEYMAAENVDNCWFSTERALYIGNTAYILGGSPCAASFEMYTGRELYKKDFTETFEALYREHNPDTYGECMTTPAYDPGAVIAEPAEPLTEAPDAEKTTAAPQTVPTEPPAYNETVETVTGLSAPDGME